ncbi:MAG: hypothetical protein ACE14S_07960 [Candidatus Bathyarchaeia archaeon]
MTEPAPSNEEPAPQKLLIDDPSNFQFHAAYMVYSDLFDSATTAEVKRDLNQNIESLKKGAIDPETFYRNIARYRRDVVPERRHDRLSVQTQRKRDWRVKSQKQERIRRHKK